MKRYLGFVLILVFILQSAACGVNMENNISESTRTFVDSCGREVVIPKKIERIAVTGSMAQIIVFAIAPDLLVGVSGEWDKAAEPYIDEAYLNLPVLGQLYGGKGELNLETLLQSGAQIVIDIGDAKSGVAEDMDALQQQTGLPFVHLDASLFTLEQTYMLLGELLDRGEQAAVLSGYCREIYDRATSISVKVEKKECLYLLGEQGLNVIGRDTYHSGVIDLMTENIAVLDNPSSKGTGNEVDMEQLMLWDPEFIIFAPGSIYHEVASDPLWQNLQAIREGNYIQAPMGPYNWISMPPSAQQLLGLIWLGAELYPDDCGYDLYTEVATYFKLFYHTELTQAAFSALINP